jgi:hypothetical protein
LRSSGGIDQSFGAQTQDGAARDDLDSINDWVRNLGHVPLGGKTHDRYYIDMSIAPHGDFYDDGGC